ncbi:DUF1292 domain-containing protein [Clostridium saccharobutylicum]|uniref:DUF1292 domain-containing protein n=1 Tax=Clostridium saccharobutylicum DSM 13864 TaxID=1345695 RepID=U5MW14_CLOSA|nr:DUF1292 domain-containing protein [Clostridium saccharobutylicum]AGX44949.1 hypothetical protein CLSA_c39890 [Clostridium saccharobutylicum DSM 13864]AQR92231.1 hypothetical protein CLOSC_39610 [Clostridium saccharobutylicum]AQS02133.1 hypothetical protein CSACC_39660 [Clostridium saccharobutylicum]AQS11737.1 hypothetical protein CLOBY_38950 [Clostridium saccharobutylicum]AQS16116.1 hypothetical protein CLOSACC_39660 [Clostridium saccharobutylicum]
MEKDLEKSGCGCGEGNSCGCGGDHKEDHECGCGHDHGHDHDHECGCGCGDDESFVIDLEDENGNVVTCPIIDEFKYENNDYYLAQNPEEDSVYLFRLDGDELVVPDEEEFDKVSNYYQNELVGEE